MDAKRTRYTSPINRYLVHWRRENVGNALNVALGPAHFDQMLLVVGGSRLRAKGIGLRQRQWNIGPVRAYVRRQGGNSPVPSDVNAGGCILYCAVL